MKVSVTARLIALTPVDTDTSAPCCEYTFAHPEQTATCVFRIILPAHAIPSAYIGHWFKITGYTFYPVRDADKSRNPAPALQQADNPTYDAPNGTYQYVAVPDAYETPEIAWIRDNSTRVKLQQA